MSYKPHPQAEVKTAIVIPNINPVNLEQLKRDAVNAFQTMMYSSEHFEDSYLEIKTYFFKRPERLINGRTESFPGIWSGMRSDNRYFQLDKDGYMTRGTCIDNHNLRNWLNDLIPPSVSQKQSAISYISEILPS